MCDLLRPATQDAARDARAHRRGRRDWAPAAHPPDGALRRGAGAGLHPGGARRRGPLLALPARGSAGGGGGVSWYLSHRADPRAVPLADRHYNRQKPGTPQFVPPGRCLVLLTADAGALWVTSW